MPATATIATNLVDFTRFKETLAIEHAVIYLVGGNPNAFLDQIDRAAPTSRAFAARGEFLAHGLIRRPPSWHSQFFVDYRLSRGYIDSQVMALRFIAILRDR